MFRPCSRWKWILWLYKGADLLHMRQRAFSWGVFSSHTVMSGTGLLIPGLPLHPLKWQGNPWNVCPSKGGCSSPPSSTLGLLKLEGVSLFIWLVGANNYIIHIQWEQRSWPISHKDAILPIINLVYPEIKIYRTWVWVEMRTVCVEFLDVSLICSREACRIFRCQPNSYQWSWQNIMKIYLV